MFVLEPVSWVPKPEVLVGTTTLVLPHVRPCSAGRDPTPHDEVRRASVHPCGASLQALAAEATCDPHGAIDDRGGDFFTRVHNANHGVCLWSSVLKPQPDEWQQLAALGQPVRLRSRPCAVTKQPGIARGER